MKNLQDDRMLTFSSSVSFAHAQRCPQEKTVMAHFEYFSGEKVGIFCPGTAVLIDLYRLTLTVRYFYSPKPTGARRNVFHLVVNHV